MSKDDVFQPWLKERKIEDVEAFVPDMAGAARGKVLAADKLGSGIMKMPEAIFGQTISGDYVVNKHNVEDRDMTLVPFNVDSVPGFALSIQWHPEWQFEQNELSTAIFKAFGNACRQYAAEKQV